MTIVAAGSLNTTALVVPDLYVQVVPPQVLNLNGVPTNVIGVVGSASWGPVGQALIVSDSASYVAAYGYIQARRYDLGTPIATAIQQGANNFRAVRVTDGSDTAAQGAIGTGMLLYALYTGTTGDLIQVSIAPSRAGTYAVTVGFPGSLAETFDGIAGANNADLWNNAIAAINSGAGTLTGLASTRVVAAPGSDLTQPFTGSCYLSGGSDGANVNAAQMIGTDTYPRQGLYALRGTGASILVVSDLDDPGQWSTIDGVAQQEQCYAIQTGPSGDSIQNAQATIDASGVADYSTKMMFGDWLIWNDPTNQVQRLVSPQGFIAGRLANLSPEQSALNKRLFGIVASQRSTAGFLGGSSGYSTAELAALKQSGMDVITNPIPAGNIWGSRNGVNSSFDPRTNGDNYTRLTNYIASTLNGGMGTYIGQVITPTLLAEARSTLLTFLANMLGQGLLSVGLDNTLPYNVTLDQSNNPDSRTSLGYMQADVKVRYGAILQFFIVNLEAGQTVSVTVQNSALAA